MYITKKSYPTSDSKHKRFSRLKFMIGFFFILSHRGVFCITKYDVFSLLGWYQRDKIMVLSGLKFYKNARQTVKIKPRKTSPFIISVLESDATIFNRNGLRNTNQVNWRKRFENSEKLWKSFEAKRKQNGGPGIEKKKFENESNRTFLYYFRKFCKQTSLHGFNFFAKSNMTYIEKTFWIVALCFVYVICLLIITKSIYTWRSSPPIMTMDNTPIPVGYVPFPAITVCGANQIKPSVFNFSKYLSFNENSKMRLNHSYINKLDYTILLCNLESNENISLKVLDLDEFYYMINKAHTTCKEVFASIKWMNETIDDPCDFMQPILTDLGLCYSFNMIPLSVLFTKSYFEVISMYFYAGNISSWSKLQSSDWHPDVGYSRQLIKPYDIPRRTAGVGVLHSFTVSLNLQSENADDKCNLGSRGYTILVHSPAQIPSSSNAKVGINEGSVTLVTIQPKILSTLESIRSWSPERRNCYYENERELYYFKLYTQANCDLECESNYSLHSCGCVAFYHPRSILTPVCGTNKMDCIQDSLIRLSEIYTKDQRACDCLPSCTDLQYESNVLSKNAAFSIVYKNPHSIENETHNVTDSNETTESNKTEKKIEASKNVCMFSVSYNNRDMLGICRRNMNTFIDYLGNVGGILGLFLGFSCISFLEMILLCLRFTANKSKGSVGKAGEIMSK